MSENYVRMLWLQVRGIFKGAGIGEHDGQEQKDVRSAERDVDELQDGAIAY